MNVNIFTKQTTSNFDVSYNPQATKQDPTVYLGLS